MRLGSEPCSFLIWTITEQLTNLAAIGVDTNPNPAHYIYCDCLALYIITKKSNMSNQVVFGAAAVAAVAGGAYIYEQNKQRHQIPVPETEKSIPAGRDIQDKLSKTVEQTKKELEAKSK